MTIKLPEDYIVLDFETNGLPKNGDMSKVDITEVAYIFVKNKEIEVSKTVSRLCNPGVPQTEKIIELTHITDEMLKGQPSPIDLAKEVLIPIVQSNLHIVGHNIFGFDRLFLDKYCDALNIDRIDSQRYLDTAALFKTYRKSHRLKNKNWNLPSSYNDLPQWTSEMLERSWADDTVKYNLDAAVGYLTIHQFGIAYERHRALYDIILTQRVFEKLRIEMDI